MAQKHSWVVSCKNTKYHNEKNPFHGHRIPVGKAEEHSPHFEFPGTIEVRCNDPACAKTYSYAAPEIILWSGDIPPFVSHPLFG